MDPITLVSGAVSIADTLGLDEWLGELVGGKPGAKAAGQIVDMAKAVTGGGSVEETVTKLQQDKALAAELKKQIINNEHELKLAVLKDQQSARSMYQKTEHRMADRIAERIFSWNPVMIVLLVIANVAVVMYVENATIAVSAGNVIGASISYLWQERQTVVGFFFGSSQGKEAQ